MPVTTTVTNQAKVIYPAGINLASATIKCALFKTGTTLTGASTTYTSLTPASNEVANGSGYSTTGVTITGFAWSGTTTPQITGTIPAWSAATFTFRYAVIYDNATGKILTFTDFGGDQQLINGTLTLSFDGSNGYIQVSST